MRVIRTYVCPSDEKTTVSTFFGRLLDRPSDTARHKDEVVYLQSQDGNLVNDFAELLPDVGSDIPTATEALGEHCPAFVLLLGAEALGTDRRPDAVNLWIGDDRSVTSLHKGLSSTNSRRPLI